MNIVFPILQKNKLYGAKTIGSELLSVKPMSEEEAIAGREVREVDDKYDSFESLEEIKLAVIKFLDVNEDDEHFLHVSSGSITKFANNTVYYKSYSIIEIIYQEIKPKHRFRHDLTIAKIDPGKFNLGTIEELVINIRNNQ